MSISTRTYARPYSSGGGIPSAVKTLLIVNLAVFLLGFFGGGLGGVISMLALVPAEVIGSLHVWQPVTFLLVSLGVMQFIWNMLALWWFGKALEESWGAARFLQLYFLSGIGAGVCVILIQYLIGNPHTPTFGLSAPMYGIFGATAALWPDLDVVYFVFPMKMKWFVLLVAGVDFLFSYAAGVGQIAVLTGLVFGWLFVKSASTIRMRSFDPLASLRASYKDWKLRRAKRKFQVYLRKHGSDRDRFVN